MLSMGYYRCEPHISYISKWMASLLPFHYMWSLQGKGLSLVMMDVQGHSQALELLKGCFIQHATEHNVFSHLGCGRIPKTDFGYVFCLLGYSIVMLCLVTITIGHSSQFTVHSSEMMSKTPYKHWNTIHNTKVSLSDELVCIRFLKSRTLLDCDVFMHHNTTIQTAIKSSEMVVIRFTVPVIIRPRLLHFSARFQTKLPETKTETRLFWLGWRDVPARHGTLLCLR